MILYFIVGITCLIIVVIAVRIGQKREVACAEVQRALAQAPSLTSELGHPVHLQCGWGSYFELTETSTGSRAQLIADIEGPKGEGTIELTLIKKDATWEIKEVRVIPTTPVSWSDSKFLLTLGHWSVGLFFLFLTLLLGRRFAAQRGFSVWKWTLVALLFNVLLLPYIAWISGVGEKRYRIQALSLFACFLLWIAAGMYLESSGLIY